jgi:diguanylate cyclase (GGDEF)-like protein
MLKRWGYETVVACDGSEAWDVLARPDAPGLAILDWMMPGMSGLDVCRLSRQADRGNYRYFILLTAKGRQEDIIEGMNAGADDYITKPFDSGELKVRLRAAQRILDLQAELISTREALREQATHDFLTGLLNRSAILDLFYDEIARAQREEKSVGVMMCDLDRFKRINDTHGHKVGDRVLCETARRLRQSARPYDRIGRYGGEEFLIVMPGCDLTFAGFAAERLRADVAAEPVVLPDGTSIPVTLSIGVAAKLGGCKSDAETIIFLADEALYRAKRNGRNRVELANPALADQAV